MTEPLYDSTNDTLMHIHSVYANIYDITRILMLRSDRHDKSKLHPPEKAALDRYTPLLRDTTYTGAPRINEPEFRGYLAHHYAHNSHHPEHYRLGMLQMSLFDLLEMMADWKAAVERHADGNFARSMTINMQRFAVPRIIAQQLYQTAHELGWIDSPLLPDWYDGRGDEETPGYWMDTP